MESGMEHCSSFGSPRLIAISSSDQVTHSYMEASSSRDPTSSGADRTITSQV